MIFEGKGVDWIGPFDLRCKDCQNEFKKLVPYSKLPEVTCPSCGSKKITKGFIKQILKVQSVQGPAAPFQREAPLPEQAVDLQRFAD